MWAALIALILGGGAFALGGGGSTTSTATQPLGSRSTADDDDDDDIVATPTDDTPDLPDDEYTLDWGGLTAEEQMMVELVNRARMDPDAEVDRLDEPLTSNISSDPKQPLAVTPELSVSSREHSEDMDDREFFDHTNPDGQEPWDRAVEAGHGSTNVGENIGVIGSTWTDFDEQARVEDLHYGLWESDGHQENLMNDDWSEIGVGYDYGDWEDDGVEYDGATFVTQTFSDRDNTYLTGVVIDDADGDDFYDIGEGQGGVKVTAIDQEDESKVYTTSTWDAGGYTLELPPGTYRVVFEGGDLDGAQEATVTIGDENVKLDIIEEEGSGGVFASAAPEPGAEEASAMLPVLPPEEEDDIVDDPAEADLEPALL
ncbi:MAG: CAP domain-containing protein [Paracoccaceae bacterium]|nr:CAP domain-containing protein [Paracoccaceae bacterium]